MTRKTRTTTTKRVDPALVSWSDDERVVYLTIVKNDITQIVRISPFKDADGSKSFRLELVTLGESVVAVTHVTSRTLAYTMIGMGVTLENRKKILTFW